MVAMGAGGWLRSCSGFRHLRGSTLFGLPALGGRWPGLRGVEARAKLLGMLDGRTWIAGTKYSEAIGIRSTG